MRRIGYLVSILGAAALVAAVATAQAGRPSQDVADAKAEPKLVKGRSCTNEQLASPCVQWTLSFHLADTYRYIPDPISGEWFPWDNSVLFVATIPDSPFSVLSEEITNTSAAWNTRSKHYEACSGFPGATATVRVEDDAHYMHVQNPSNFPDSGFETSYSRTLPC